MSVEYSLYLRKKPRLDRDALGTMALEICEYKPQPNDPIAREPWRDSIRWVIEASGSISDYDEWIDFVARICKRLDGVLWSAATGEFERFDDNDEDGATEEDQEVDAKLIKKQERRDEAEYARLERMVAGAPTSPATMEQLKGMVTSLEFEARFAGILVRRAAQGESLGPWTWALRYVHAKAVRWSETMRTPKSRAALAKKGPLAAAIVERFETTEARAVDRKRKTQANAEQRQAKKRRDAFCLWLKEPDIEPPLIEKRRRGGEVLAGIPRSTAALAAKGRIEEAIADYSKRYDLTLEVARKVVSAQHIELLHEPGEPKPVKPRKRAARNR